MKLKNKNVLIYGMGVSGKAAVDFLKKKGARVFCFDDGNGEKAPDAKFDLCIVSPGIKVEGNSLIESLIFKKTKIMSEVELGLSFSKGKLIVVTGTNGKTTTVNLIDNILKKSGKKSFLCGNVGTPVTAICEKTTRKSFLVCEVSSFMLELTRFNPLVSCVLNVTEDHLDRHGNFENYLEIKSNIFKFQNKGIAVLNFDDNNLKRFYPHVKTLYFSRIYLSNGAFVDDRKIYYKKKYVMGTTGIQLLGEKNLENVLAAVTVCSWLKVKPEMISEAVKTFKPLKHRLETLGCKKGITFINDSKATNPDGTVAALRAFDGYPLLLMGGRNKDSLFDPVFYEKFRTVYAYGECRYEVAECAAKFGRDYQIYRTLKEATAAAFNDAKTGDMILLSPACASFDEFKDYADRGEKFKLYFMELGNEEKTDV